VVRARVLCIGGALLHALFFFSSFVLVDRPVAFHLHHFFPIRSIAAAEAA
jgi:hypothetical protein